jgi:hypothetical protein
MNHERDADKALGVVENATLVWKTLPGSEEVAGLDAADAIAVGVGNVDGACWGDGDAVRVVELRVGRVTDLVSRSTGSRGRGHDAFACNPADAFAADIRDKQVPACIEGDAVDGTEAGRLPDSVNEALCTVPSNRRDGTAGGDLSDAVVVGIGDE